MSHKKLSWRGKTLFGIFALVMSAPMYFIGTSTASAAPQFAEIKGGAECQNNYAWYSAVSPVDGWAAMRALDDPAIEYDRQGITRGKSFTLAGPEQEIGSELSLVVIIQSAAPGDDTARPIRQQLAVEIESVMPTSCTLS